MNLDVLEHVDRTAASGILAAAVLANSPDPGVGERPLILRRYEKEANAALAEIRRRLNIPENLTRLRLVCRSQRRLRRPCVNLFFKVPIQRRFSHGSVRRDSWDLPHTMSFSRPSFALHFMALV